MDWSAERYGRFETERNRPARDLIAACPATGIGWAADLGCGPGNSTELIRRRYPAAEIIGIDTSPDMVAAARRRLPECTFEIGDVAAWHPERSYDLLFANASLQWMPDHAALLPALLDRLAPGGWLAIQIPDNWNEPSHRAMRDVALHPRWRGRLIDAERIHAHRHAPEWYHRLLRPLTASLDLWRTTYFHELEGGPDAIVDWFRGSALRPLLARLDEAERADFLERYRAAIANAHATLPDGRVLLPFPRLFIVARTPR